VKIKLLILAVAAAVPLSAHSAVENYGLDPYHTFANFSLDHLGLATIYGRFDKNSGKFSLDRAAKTGAVEFNIETASVTTGDNDKGSRARSRDEHLRSADFFNVAEFPRMTFKSTAVHFGPEFPTSVEGNLTLLGATKPVTLTFERFKCVQNTPPRKDRCGGNAVGKIKRSEFGMKTGIPSIGDEISLNIMFEGDKQ
jgi:polyisoprenoid-binding protein YceI